MMERYRRLILLLTALLGILLISALALAGAVVEGKVTSLHGDLVILKSLKTLTSYSSTDPFSVIFKGASILV
jgi:hypothetical protein